VRRAFAAAVLAALACVPAAGAHGGDDKGYRSTVQTVRPALPGVELTVIDNDDRIRLENGTDKTIVIKGYGGEPYIRFADGAVFENRNSPAAYLNDDRFAQVDVPANANKDAPPDWVKVADASAYEWHDHRAHWMSPIAPRPIRDEPDRDHHVFDWEVPGEADGRAFTIAGSLDYTPPPDESAPWTFIVVTGVLLAVTIAAIFLLRRRMRRA
jgi:hypothetical protein